MILQTVRGMGRVRPIATIVISLALALGVGATAVASASASSKPRATSALTPAQITSLKAAVAAAERPSTWAAPGPALKAKGLKGKSIFLLNEGVSEFNSEFTTGVQAAARAVGMPVLLGNSLDVATQSQDIEEAVSEHVSAIVLNAEDPRSVASALIKAKAAGIIVVSAFNGDPGLPTAVQKADGVYGNVSYCYSCSGALIAEYEVLKTQGHVVAGIQQMQGLPSSDRTVNGFVTVIKKYCPKTCSEAYADIPINGERTQPIESAATAAVDNPSINVLLPVYDFMIEYELPIVQSGHASSRIDIDSQNADLAPMQELASKTAVRLEVGNPTVWDGWGAVDQALRGLLHMAPVSNEKVPLRLFDRTNVGALNLKAAPGTWYGPSNYQASYRTLWGV